MVSKESENLSEQLPTTLPFCSTQFSQPFIQTGPHSSLFLKRQRNPNIRKQGENCGKYSRSYMSQKLSLREELKDASLQVIKDRIHKELVSMNNEELHTFIRLQRESDRSQDPKTFNLNMLSLIDQVNEAKGQRISSSEDTQATANELVRTAIL